MSHRSLAPRARAVRIAPLLFMALASSAISASGVGCGSSSNGPAARICGPGTAEDAGECVSISLDLDGAAFCGPGTTFSSGVCVPLADATATAADAAANCGPGTVLSGGRCVAALAEDASAPTVDAAMFCGPGTFFSAGLCLPLAIDAGIDATVPEAGPGEAGVDAPAFSIDAPVERADGGPPFSVVTSARLLGSATEGALADFNEDHNLDLVVVGTDLSAVGGAVIALGDGYGGFVYETTVTGMTSSLGSVAVGDFSHSGHQDLVTLAYGSGPYLARGKGDGTFMAATNLYPSNTLFSGGDAVGVGDFNGDGWLDIAVGAGSMYIMYNDHTGGFSAPVVAGTAGVFDRFGIGDLNGDGIDDLAWGTNQLWIATSNGDAGTFTATELPNSGSGTRSVALGNLVAGGPLDIVATDTGASPVLVEQQRMNGTYIPEVAYGGNVVDEAVITGDFDGDGTIDVASSENNPASMVLFHGNGDGTLAAPAIYPLSSSPAFVVGGKVTRDGKLDIVAVTGGGYAITLAR